MGVDFKAERMPFGAQILNNGETRFRLWMPQQEKVIPSGEGTPRIYLPDDDKSYPMNALGDGWYEFITDRAADGSRYMVEFWNIYQETPGWTRAPDPASVLQERDRDGYSVVVDAKKLRDRAFRPHWKGVALEDSIFYEMHIGSFTPEGTLNAAREKLSYLKDLGITMIEFMPLGTVGCDHDWGYDETLKAALHPAYGTPEDMADFVAAAHDHGIGVMFDVVDNHLGPDGHFYALHTPELWKFADFDAIHTLSIDDRVVEEGYSTPWGPSIDFSREEVRKFFIQKNEWLQYAYGIDGLRRDAVHALRDDLHDKDPTRPHYLSEIFEGAVNLAHSEGRHHFQIVLENEHNQPSVLSPDGDDREARGHAQWSDDFHHTVRSLLFRDAPEKGFIDKGYYTNYTGDPVASLAEILSRGYALSLDTARNEKQSDVDRDIAFDPRRSVTFTTNHDQIGNTAKGQRMEELLSDDPFRTQKLRFASTLLMLSPMLPMIFMGQERALETRFPFFATWTNELGAILTESRKKEFPQYKDFADPADPATFAASKLPWDGQETMDDTFGHYQGLIVQRKRDIIPHLSSGVAATHVERFGETGINAQWEFGDGASYRLLLNPGNRPQRLPGGASLAPWTVNFEKLGAVQPRMAYAALTP